MAVNLQEIVEKFSGLDVYEKRESNDVYNELVFFSKDLETWNKIFTEILGPPVKPKGLRATRDDIFLTKDYGGLWENQTLFKKEDDGVVIFAMFWPWDDDDHITLKVVCVKK